MDFVAYTKQLDLPQYTIIQTGTPGYGLTLITPRPVVTKSCSTVFQENYSYLFQDLYMKNGDLIALKIVRRLVAVQNFQRILSMTTRLGVIIDLIYKP